MNWLAGFGLLDAGALAFAALIPLLVVAYLARERPRQALVSSVLAFRALHVMRGHRFGGRPRFPWTFFLEAAALLLAVLALAGPYLLRRGTPIAIVIDNSAPMQAVTPGGKTRFALALERVADALHKGSGSSQVTVYLTAPTPHQIDTFASTGAAAAAIAQARPVDAPDDPAALASLLAQLNADRRIGRILVAGYRAIAPPVPPRVEPLTVGEPLANYAIGSFTLSRESFGAAALHARLTLANFSPAPATLRVTVTGDGVARGNAEVNVQPGAVAGVEFPNLAPAAIYRAQLEPADGFMLDNVAYATGAAVKPVAVLFVSPVPGDGGSLAGIPGLAVTTRTPTTFVPDDLAAADVAIFEYTVPKGWPAVNTLLVMPPPGDSLFNFSVEPAARLAVTNWPSTDPLTAGVNFRLLNLRAGEYLGVHPWLRAVVAGDAGGLLLSGERAGRRFVVAGFNPFPYLGRQNLPMSILTLNLLSSLAGFDARTAGFRTGEPWIVPTGVNSVITPSGVAAKVRAGSLFSDTAVQGIYQLHGATGPTSARAVNLASLTDSDLEDVPPLAIAPLPAIAPTTAVVRTLLTPYVIAVIIGLIIFEALLVYRRRAMVTES